MKKIILISLIVVSSSVFAQETDQPSSPQVYAGANLNLIVLGGHLGVKDIVDNFGVRLDVITTLPVAFAPGVILGLNGFYTFYEEGNTAFYAGGGAKVPIGNNGVSGISAGPFGVSAIGGAEFEFQSFNTFVEVDFTVINEVNAFLPIIPIVRLGFSIPF